MSYLALYRKYRPLDFSSVYGQEKVVKVIENEISNNKVSHAYLFSGPRGTGKTTIAKIIARLVNCENLVNSKPCGKCYNCINFNSSNDVIEIDAASNNGVDEIRELRDKINLVPTNAKYKVYIIDEVHMLTTQAFNALLKTLEEPPKHVIFILATTELHKIPLTIASRCQKFQFSKIDDEQIKMRLSEIAQNENIKIEDEALFEIARLSDGCMRDAVNLLDQIAAYNIDKIILEDVYKVSGAVSYDYLYDLLSAVLTCDKGRIIELIDNLNVQGKNIEKFIEEMILFLKDAIVYRNTGILSSINSKNEKILLINGEFSDSYLYNFINELNETSKKIKVSSHQYIILMVSLLKFANDYCNNSDVPIKKNDFLLENKKSNIIQEKSTVSNETEIKDEKNISREIISSQKSLKNNSIDIRINNALATASKEILKKFRDGWDKIDDFIFDDDFSVIAGLLKDSVPVVASDSYVIIQSDLVSTVDRINQNYDMIEKLFARLFDYKVKIVAMTSSSWMSEKQKYIVNIKNGNKYVIKDDDDVTDIKNESDKVKSPVDELLEIVGENIIEYK